MVPGASPNGPRPRAFGSAKLLPLSTKTSNVCRCDVHFFSVAEVVASIGGIIPFWFLQVFHFRNNRWLQFWRSIRGAVVCRGPLLLRRGRRNVLIVYLDVVFSPM